MIYILLWCYATETKYDKIKISVAYGVPWWHMSGEQTGKGNDDGDQTSRAATVVE